MDVIAPTFGGKVIWSYFSQFEVTEGLIVITLLLLLTFVIKFSGLDSPFDSPVFSYHLRSPNSCVCTVLSSGGTISYALLVLCNMQQLRTVFDFNGLNVVQYPSTSLDISAVAL